MLDGIVTRVTLFHGKKKNEADWHVYIALAPDTSLRLADFLSARGTSVKATDLSIMYCELMVLDLHKDPWVGFNEFYSADVTLPLNLYEINVEHPAWEFGYHAVEDKGSHEFSKNSRLIGGRAYLQGAFVNDSAHGVRVEIHPLDSIAFAMDQSGTTLWAKQPSQCWPASYVKWRVAVFTNSNFHRINKESYLKKERTTTWYLELPNNAYETSTGLIRPIVDEQPGLPGPYVIHVEEQRQRLWDGARKIWYSGRGWSTFPSWELAVDPRDGRKKLKVTSTMKIPDNFGGIAVCDYVISVTPKSPPPVPPVR
jgi:hypothetical protein